MSRASVFGIVLVSAGMLLSSPNRPLYSMPEEGYDRALLKLRRGAFEESLAEARRAGALWQRPDTEWYWTFRLLEADILLEQAEISRAQALLETDVAACRQFGRAEIRRRTLLAKLSLRLRKPDLARARSLLEEARNMASGDDAEGLRAEIDVLRGQVLARQNLDAIDVLHSAQQSARRAGDEYQYAAAANNLGMIQQKRSRCDQAIPYFEQALQIWHKLGVDQLAAVTANNLGLCYSDLGGFDKASEYRQEALRLVKPGPRTAEVQGETGRFYLIQDQPREAIPYFQRALDAAKRFNPPAEGARWANNLATAYREAHNWDAAEKANQEALNLNPDPRSIPPTQLNQAAIASGRGRLEEAEAIYKQIIASNSGNQAVLWQAYAGLASISLAAGNWEQAKESFEDGIRVVEQSRSGLNGAENKITFLSRLIRFYQDYVDALMDRNLPVRALEVADSSRARILAEGLSRSANLEEGAHGADQLKALARGSKSTWLAYWVAPRRSFLWIVTPNEIRSAVLPPSAEIVSAVERYRGFIETSMRDPLKARSEAGNWLFTELVQKAQEFIPAGSRVTIVPDGPLHQLNFETLPIYAEQPRYWIEDVAIAVAPSFGICIGQTKSVAAKPKSVLIIGDPDSPGPDFPKLPHAATEIANLERRFEGSTTRVVTGSEAQPAGYGAWTPGRYSLIHIAAHGEANRRSPLDSALILSPGPDGFKLYARDVAQIPLHADLVTISACRSSGARTYAGEGLVGLARAFLQAGASSVIAGLWDVADRSTSEIMDRMYSQIEAGTPAGESLRQAKLASIHGSYGKPYYWGPFQVYTRRPVNF